MKMVSAVRGGHTKTVKLCQADLVRKKPATTDPDIEGLVRKTPAMTDPDRAGKSEQLLVGEKPACVSVVHRRNPPEKAEAYILPDKRYVGAFRSSLANDSALAEQVASELRDGSLRGKDAAKERIRELNKH